MRPDICQIFVDKLSKSAISNSRLLLTFVQFVNSHQPLSVGEKRMQEKQLPAVLLLADGTVAHGFAFGAIGTTTGEICFNTGMTGYQEVFTDPSYFGQILIMNSAHIVTME